MFKSNIELLDKPTFIGSLLLLFIVVIPLVFFPKEGAEWIAAAKILMTDKLGFMYLGLGLASFFFMIYIIFSDIGQIKLCLLYTSCPVGRCGPRTAYRNRNT